MTDVKEVTPDKQPEITGVRIKSFIERIERLEAEAVGIKEDIKEYYAEAKGNGFCTKTLRRIIALRKKDVEKRREEAELLELYMAAIGMPE